MNFKTILRFKQFDFLVCYRKLSAHMHMLFFVHFHNIEIQMHIAHC